MRKKVACCLLSFSNSGQDVEWLEELGVKVTKRKLMKGFVVKVVGKSLRRRDASRLLLTLLFFFSSQAAFSFNSNYYYTAPRSNGLHYCGPRFQILAHNYYSQCTRNLFMYAILWRVDRRICKCVVYKNLILFMSGRQLNIVCQSLSQSVVEKECESVGPFKFNEVYLGCGKLYCHSPFSQSIQIFYVKCS